MENMLRVGVITSTHGVRGEVKVFPTTDDAKRFKKLKTVILDTGKGQTTLEIEQVKFFKNMVILKFKGYDNINDVETWRQKDLLITREQAAPAVTDLHGYSCCLGINGIFQKLFYNRSRAFDHFPGSDLVDRSLI